MVWHASVGKLSSGRDGQETAEPKMKIQRKRDAEKNDQSRRTGGEESQLSKSTEGSGDVGTYKVIQIKTQPSCNSQVNLSKCHFHHDIPFFFF